MKRRLWTETDDWLLCMAREHDRLSTADCARKVNRSYTAVETRLGVLRGLGKIRERFRVDNPDRPVSVG